MEQTKELKLNLYLEKFWITEFWEPLCYQYADANIYLMFEPIFHVKPQLCYCPVFFMARSNMN